MWPHPMFSTDDRGCERDRRVHPREAMVNLGSRKCHLNTRATDREARGPLKMARDSSWKTQHARKSGRAIATRLFPRNVKPRWGIMHSLGTCTQGAPEYRRPWALELNAFGV